MKCRQRHACSRLSLSRRTLWRGAPRCGQTSCRHWMAPWLSRNSTTFSPRISTPTGLSFTCSEMPAHAQSPHRRHMHIKRLRILNSPLPTGTACMMLPFHDRPRVKATAGIVAWKAAAHLLRTRSCAGTSCGRPAPACGARSLRCEGPAGPAAGPPAPSSQPASLRATPMQLKNGSAFEAAPCNMLPQIRAARTRPVQPPRLICSRRWQALSKAEGWVAARGCKCAPGCSSSSTWGRSTGGLLIRGLEGFGRVSAAPARGGAGTTDALRSTPLVR